MRPGESLPALSRGVSDRAETFSAYVGFVGARSLSGKRDFISMTIIPTKISGISASSCPLCHLTQHLERPEIDREATLIWLPELTQGVLNALVWDIHLTLAKHGRPLCLERPSFSAPPPARAAASAYAALKDRGLAALTRIGTTSPRDLAEALLRLSPSSYDRRAELLGGARLLPLGRFLWNGRDVFPQLVETLKSISKRQDLSAARRFQEKDLTQ